MFHVHSSFMSNMKNINGNIKPKKVSVVNTELTLRLLQFACTNLDGSQKEGVNFLNLLQKEGGSNPGGTMVNHILKIINFPLPGHKLRFSVSNI